MTVRIRLLAIFLLAVLAAAAAIAFAGNVLVSLVTLPLVLVLPGYALSAALLPTRDGPFEETLLHSLGLSLAIVVLVGLVLNFTPWGLTLESWAVALPAVTGASALVAIFRGRGTRADAQVAPARRAKSGLGFGSTILLGLSVLALVAAVAVTRLALAAQPAPEFAQLWIKPADPAGQDRYDLGVRNAGATAAAYRLEASAGDTVVYQFSDIVLAPGETWERIVQIPAQGNAVVTARLYQRDSSQVYRHVDIWTNGQ